MQQNNITIVGAGPVGLALALALKQSGLNITLADMRPPEAIAADPRVLALAYGTCLTLEQLGIWKSLPATAIRNIHISQQGGFGRTRLSAEEHHLPALGYVLSAGTLAAVLRKAVDAAGIPVLDNTTVTRIQPSAHHVDIEITDNASQIRRNLTSHLAVCAEGVINTDSETKIIERDYHQHALIGYADVKNGHQHTAFERFTPNGPVALLPCNNAFAIVHVTSPSQADRLLAFDDAAYLSCLQSHLGNRVKLTAIRDRLRYPLLLRYRPQPIGKRTAWLGNAAQTMHPVAGQGFNLALRDTWTLAQTLLQHVSDPGSNKALQQFAAARQLDRTTTIGFTDSLVQIFSNDFAPLRHARGAALFALDLFPPLRHFIAKRMMFGARA